MKRETHEYLAANRTPGHIPGEFTDSLPDVEGTLEEVMERALREAWENCTRRTETDPATEEETQ